VSVELHLPDLPDVPISVGPERGTRARTRSPWHWRLRDTLTAYLPLLLMALLALASWWLVKNSPRALGIAEEASSRLEPDYAMHQFAMERFDAQGRLKLRVEGLELRHFPASDRIEIDDAQIRAISADGRVTLAHARRAIGTGDGSEMQLLGGAEVLSTDANKVPLRMNGEFLHAFFVTERVKSHLPVQVALGDSQMQGAGLEYDHAARRLELLGPLRAELAPRGASAPATSAAGR
jgi:lipopolysaccharide export system protein LptC